MIRSRCKVKAWAISACQQRNNQSIVVIQKIIGATRSIDRCRLVFEDGQVSLERGQDMHDVMIIVAS